MRYALIAPFALAPFFPAPAAAGEAGLTPTMAEVVDTGPPNAGR